MTDDAPDLRPFARALGEALDERARAHAPVPDLADVLARAQVLAPRRVPAGLQQSLPIDEALEDDRDEPDVADPRLRAFTQALRERHEQRLGERRHAPIPPVPAARRVRAWVVAAVAVAVMVVVIVGAGLEIVTRERTHGASPMAAEQSTSARPTGGRMLERRPSAEARELASATDEAATDEAATDEPVADEPVADEPVADEPVADEPVADEPVADEPGADEPAAGEPVRSPLASDAPGRGRGPSTATLEAQAREAWRSGQLERAERLFRAIVRREGRGARADLAYGDLFSLVRQRRGTAALAELWREYLRRFPRGRYAQDARAGLCRRAGADERAACWRRYLEAYPEGTFAREAKAAAREAGR